MILRICHIKIAGGIEGDAPGIVERAWFGAGAADDFERFVVRIEHLNTTVPELADILAPRVIDTNIVRITEFA
jgi:hypothetical protein